MADWYVSAAAYAAIAQWAASTAYTVGQIIRPLTAPAFSANYAFRCTTAGTTGGTEPSYAGTTANNNGTVTSGTAVFTNVSGQSTYAWGAAAGNLLSITNNGSGGGRFSAGDRVYLASDHTETNAGGSTYRLDNGSVFGAVAVTSVNRGGSVPPAAADVTPGAVIIATAGSGLIIDNAMDQFWQGITFEAGNGGSTSLSIELGTTGYKTNYFSNCVLWLNNTNTGSQIKPNNPGKAILDNTVLRFGATAQGIAPVNYPFDFAWVNTPSAINASGSIPTSLFLSGTVGVTLGTLRGVDLSALTTTLFTSIGPPAKLLLDSCKIASGLTRYGTGSLSTSMDEIELINCYDGTSILNERHTPAGDLTTEFSITLAGGATDNVGAFSHRMISSARSDKWALQLESFWLDVNYTLVGSSRTATVEIVSSASLNNDDIWLYLEYEGTSGSPVASFVSSVPATIVTTNAAVPTSSASWYNAPATPVYQHLQVVFTPQIAGRLRGQVRLAKPSTTVWINPQITVA